LGVVQVLTGSSDNDRAALYRDDARRTPENDPTMAKVGPKLVRDVQLDPGYLTPIALRVGRAMLAREAASGDTLVAADLASGKLNTVYQAGAGLSAEACDLVQLRCVLSEQSRDLGAALNAPAKLLMLDGDTVTPLDVPAFGAQAILTHKPLSPDGEWIVAWVERKKTTRLVAYNRTTKRTVEVAAQRTPDGLRLDDVIDWRKDPGGWTALVETRDSDGGAIRLRDWRLDGSAKLVAHDGSPDDGQVSPDGNKRAKFTTDGKLVISPLPAGPARVMTLHPIDAKAKVQDCDSCWRWIDNRYLEFFGIRTGVIDTETLKIGFWPDAFQRGPGDEDMSKGPRHPTQIVIGPMAHYALEVGPHGTYVSHIEMPR
jgi:hypothetical protein